MDLGKKTYCKPLQWPDVWVLHPGQIYLVHTVPRIIDDNSFTSHPKYALQSLPGFAEVFYRWDSLLGGLFVAGLGGAIQYMHDRFLEQKSGKKRLRCLRDWKCGSDWRPVLWGSLRCVEQYQFHSQCFVDIIEDVVGLKSPCADDVLGVVAPRWMGIRTRDPASLWTPGMLPVLVLASLRVSLLGVPFYSKKIWYRYKYVFIYIYLHLER